MDDHCEALASVVDECARRARLGSAGRADEQDLALELQARHSRLDEGACGQVVLDGRAGDERDAVAATHRARHGLLQTELEPHVEVAQLHPGAAQLVLDHLPHAGALLHHDQPLVLQLLERHRLPGERVARRAGQDHGVAEERLVLHGAVARRGADDAELERPVCDMLDDRLGVEDAQSDVDLWVHGGELTEELREDDTAGPGRSADRERAFQCAGGLLG